MRQRLQPNKIYPRDMDGLIDACFDQLQDLRDGISNAKETSAFAAVADNVVRIYENKMKERALQLAHEQRVLELENERLQLTREKEPERLTYENDPDPVPAED